MNKEEMIVTLNTVIEAMNKHDLKLMIEDYKRLHEERNNFVPLATHNMLIEKQNAEIADLKTELREAGEIISSCIRESGKAEERGALRLAKYIVRESEHSCSSVDDLMEIYRGLK